MKNTMTIVLIALLFGCGNQQEADYFNQLLKKDSGVFRGVHIKNGEKEIRAHEDDQFLEVDENVFLKYKYPFDEKMPEKGHYEIEYYLDGQDQLHEMIINAFITNKEDAHLTYEKLSEYFTGKYGKSTKNKEEYLIWQGKTENTNVLEIALIDDSKNNESTGYLTLQINDFDY